ncbi:hypothetical protein [Halosimplex amylolyticum]|uniref:hypothetical protein n=1 Tax=Halosimplex amylolyticum TaxID=3396616 RepID=UPI003F55C37A
MRGDRSRIGPVALVALLLVSSVAAPFATGLVGAQSDTYERTMDTADVRFIGFDTTDWGAATFTVEVVAEDGPGGTPVTLYREEMTTASVQDGSVKTVVFENAGAYETITMRIEGAPADPNIGPGSQWSKVNWDNKNRLGSTGGDRDLTCDTMESMSEAVNPAVNIVDCGATPDSQTVNTTGIDANETKLEIYQSGAAQADAGENHLTMLENRLQDTETVSLIKGKAAYIRSLNALGSESTAKAEANANISEYYSAIETNHIAEWNAKVYQLQYLHELANSTTGVSQEDVFGFNTTYTNSNVNNVNITGFGSTSYQLQNGSSATVATIEVEYYVYNPDNTWSQTHTASVGVSTGTVSFGDGTSDTGDDLDLHGVEFLPPTDNHEMLPYANFDRYAAQLTEIDSQTTSAIAQMDTVVNQTYDQYQAGEINNSDLIDPFTLQNEFSPGDEYQGWAASTLSMLGTNQPTDLDQTGYMNITLGDGTQLQGIVQSAENPPTGEFAVNQTYNPANINGTQWITTDSQTRELTQNFTLSEIQTVDGKSRTNFTIVEKTYETTSADDMKALYQELSLLREEIEAREDNLNGGAGGGGGLLGGGSGTAALVVVAGAAALILVGNGGGRR